MKITLSTLELFKHINSDEVIELTDEQRSKLQEKLLEILLDVDSVCEKYSLKSYLAFGNALGAVRHKGFIPWDDDADIYMLRSDYEKFIRVFPLEMGDKYWLHTPEYTKDHLLLLGKVRLKNTSLKTYEDFNNPECGAFIDIFVIENVPDNVVLRSLHGTVSMGLAFVASCRKFFCLRKYLRRIVKDNPDLQFAYAIKVAIGCITAVLPMETWLHINTAWNSICKNENSKYLTIPTGRKHYFGEMMPRKDILPGYRTDYEGTKLYVFQHIEKYLNKVYGSDYMTPPPKDRIEKHAFLKPFYLDSNNRI